MTNTKYKFEEAAHYDNKARGQQNNNLTVADFVTTLSRENYYKKINNIIGNQSNLNVLDYGCGNGHRHFNFAESNNIIGIDISLVSIAHALDYAQKNNLKAEYHVMDCEETNFPDNFFDVILDYGTLSSLDFFKASNELFRLLKVGGSLICIETYGHNPFMKVKRMINVLRGTRTKWAASHILKNKNWKYMAKTYGNIDIQYYHITVLILPIIFKLFPYLSRERLLKLFNNLDMFFLKFDFLNFFAFKTVVVIKKLTVN